MFNAVFPGALGLLSVALGKEIGLPFELRIGINFKRIVVMSS